MRRLLRNEAAFSKEIIVKMFIKSESKNIYLI